VKLHASFSQVSQFRILSQLLVKKKPTCGPTQPLSIASAIICASIDFKSMKAGLPVGLFSALVAHFPSFVNDQVHLTL
jgi:hypothetical protein